jgi:hypothetical protein
MQTNDVCKAEPIKGVACSPLGPISLGYGQKCLEAKAEPLWLIQAALDCDSEEELKTVLVEGLKRIPLWWVTSLKVYDRGVYQPIMEWAARRDLDL